MEHRTIEWRTGDNVRVDATDFEAAVGRGRAGDARGFEEATTLYRGPLLPTCYDDWAVAERERFHGLYIEATEGLVASLEDRREYARAMQLLRQLIQLDPLHEPAYQALMRIAALAGNRSAGLQAYHAAVTISAASLAWSPVGETQAIYGRLLALDSTAAAEPTPASQPDRVRHGDAPSPSASSDATPPVAVPSAPAASDQSLVGRTAEWAAMLEAWGRASSGTSRLLALRGEAGIGKTRLLEELVRWCRARGLAAAYTRSYAAEGALAYAPIADWLRATPIRSSFDGLGDVWLSELARVLPELLAEKPALPPPTPMAESWQRKRLFEAIGHAVHSASVPLLLVLDDIQWADDESLEWLHYLLRDDTSSGILVAVGIRAEEQHSNTALDALLSDMVRRDQVDLLDLNSLSESETTALARQVVGHPVDEAALAGLYRETEGHPLYVVELARGGITPVPAGAAAGAGATRLPPRMQAVIAARLAQLSESAREIVDLAATIGRAFTFDLLQHAGDLEEPALVRALDELWQRQVIREQALNAYDFAHDRIREVAYSGIAPARRRLLHRRVARALELRHADDPDAVSPDLAAHFEAAGLADVAIDWYERAADVAKRLSANGEALNHLQKAIALVGQLPPSSDRDRRELKLQMAAGGPLVAERGYASGDLAGGSGAGPGGAVQRRGGRRVCAGGLGLRRSCGPSFGLLWTGPAVPLSSPRATRNC